MSDEPKAESRTVDSVVGQWIPVETALPDPSALVVFVSDGAVCVGHKDNANPESHLWYDHLRRDRDGDFDDQWKVTHWMPIPPLPNNGSRGAASAYPGSTRSATRSGSDASETIFDPHEH